MALTSPAQVVLEVNQALCTMLGYSDKEVLAKSLRGLTHPADVSANRELAERALAGEIAHYELEKRYFHKNGQVIWALLRVSLVRDNDGTPFYFISHMSDITQRKQAEAELREALHAAQAANRARNQFLAMMSHELRTPMQAVLGYADLLLAGANGALSPEQSDDIRTIRRGAERLITLVGQMLDLSRLEAGQLDLVLEQVDLGRIIEQVREDVAPQAAAKGLALDIALPSSLPVVTGDPQRVRQILLNLVGNAVKFTERGGVRIVAGETAEGVSVAVSDTGVGIPPEALPHIFQEFRQAESGMTRRYDGAGLGLAIARGLAAQHGGTITVQSEPHVGSTFTLHLPIAAPAGS
jgi:PAS domain S-box-containing protein